jgi:hypothetical protein
VTLSRSRQLLLHQRGAAGAVAAQKAESGGGRARRAVVGADFPTTVHELHGFAQSLLAQGEINTPAARAFPSEGGPHGSRHRADYHHSSGFSATNSSQASSSADSVAPAGLG